jgi:dTDP-4-amino-4,6-dideoxygalactose transaminase
MNWRIPLTDPDIGAEEIAAVTKVLESRWLTMGSATETFEKEFAARLNVRYAFAVTNCTAALHLANLALGIGVGDEVICPSLTFVASANATKYTGAEVVFADVVSAADLTVSPTDIARKITARTKAITVVHYAGFACQMDEILALAAEHGLAVIEDAAHAPFGRHRFHDGRCAYLGTIGAAGCFSFFGNKNMTTGEGGMVVTNDSALAEKIRLLRSHGMTTLTYDRHKGHASGYDVVALGHNYRIDELRAAIGTAQLGKIERLNERRRAVYRWYLDQFHGAPQITAPFADRDLSLSTCHIMPILVDYGADEIRARLQEERVQTSRHYPPVDSFSIYRSAAGPALSLDAGNLITLPLGPAMTQDDVRFVAGVVKDFFGRRQAA